MALQKQIVSVPLKLGIDQAESPALVDQSRFLSLTNVVFDRGNLGELHKRNGYTGYPLTDSSSYSVSDISTVGVFNNEQLIVGYTNNPAIPQQNVLGFADSTNSWNTKGSISSIAKSERVIANTGTSTSAVDMASSSNGITTYAWIDISGNLHVKCLDEATGSVYSTVSTSGAVYNAVRVLNSSTYSFVLFMDNAGNISIAQCPLASPSSGFNTVGVDIITGVTGLGFDACINNGYIVVVANTSSNLSAWNMAITSAGTVANGPTVIINTTNTGVVCCSPEATTKVFVSCIAVDGSNVETLRGVFITASGLSAGTVFSSGTATTIGPGSPGQVVSIPRIGATYWDNVYSSTQQYMVYEIYSGENVQPQICSITCDETLGFANNFVQALSVKLASAPFIYDLNPYVYTVFQSKTQQTLFLMTVLPNQIGGLAIGKSLQVVGKFLSGSAGNAPGNIFENGAFTEESGPCLPRVQQLSTDITNNTFAVGTPDALQFASVNGVATPIYGVAEIAVNLDATLNRVPNTQLGGNTVFSAGGLTYGYDGSNVAELGFNIYPEPPTVTFNTSQISIVVDAINEQLGSPFTNLSIYIPDNAVNPGGPIGQLITPGEYFTFNSCSLEGSPVSASNPTQTCFYYTVNDNGTISGSAPTWCAGASVSTQAIPISINNTAIEVANLTYQALENNLVYWTIAYNQVNGNGTYQFQRITAIQNIQALTVVSPPSMNRTPAVWQVYQGATGAGPGNAAITSINCIPASLITGGQWFQFSLLDPDSTGSTQPCLGYIWFTVAGAGSDPKPLINSSTPVSGIQYIGGVPVALTGNENEVGVANAVISALNTQYAGSAFTIYQCGPQLTIWSGGIGGGVIPATAYSSNPINVGMGQGYCGTVVDNVSGYEAQQFVAVYEWYDGQGQLHQSAPSVPTQVNVPVYVTVAPNNTNGLIPNGTAIPPSASFTVSVQNLWLTQKQFNNSATVSLAIYQTQSDQQTFYRITNPESPLLNNAGSLIPTTFIADLADSPVISGVSTPKQGLAANQPLYTTGGILENDGPPSASIVCNHQDRIFLSGLEQNNVIWFSEEFSLGLGLAFSAESTITVNTNVGQTICGPITALASMDSNLIIFQENAVQFTSGTGPDSTGSNGSFAPPQLVASSTSVGCRDPGSVTLLPQGLLFKSNAGWYLLDRSLQLHPVGKSVQAYNADICTRAITIPNSTQVRCLSESGTTLVYDWYYDSWGTFTPHQGFDACVGVTGFYTYINSGTGIVQYEDPGSYSDPTSGGFAMSMTTSWLKLNGVQGFGALYWLLVKGSFLGTQPYQVQIAYNYDPTIVNTYIYQPLAGTNAAGTIAAWGTSTWGTGTPWGITGGIITYPNSLQFEINPQFHHVESIQLTFTELAPYSTNNTWSLDALDIELGIRTGGFKNIGGNQRIG